MTFRLDTSTGNIYTKFKSPTVPEAQDKLIECYALSASNLIKCNINSHWQLIDIDTAINS